MIAIMQRMRIPLIGWNWPEEEKLAEGRGRWRLGPHSILGLCPGEKLFCSFVYTHFRCENCPSSLMSSLFCINSSAIRKCQNLREAFTMVIIEIITLPTY